MPLTIAFTSCMDAERCTDQPVWAALQAARPDVLMLLGDQIYMDWGLSLARTPETQRAYRADKAAAKEAFAREMYERYQAQWNVKAFRECVCQLVQQGTRLLMVWDEHDFAWNNAYGAGNGERSVPAELQEVARTLFRQFYDMLKAGENRDYLGLPDSFPSDTTLGPGYQRITAEGVPLIVLDQRSHRTQRDEDDGRILGVGDEARLLDDVRTGSGLLVVAGSSPLRHPYLLGEQGWWAPAKAGLPARQDGTRAYPEYRSFLTAARDAGRPVLYLAGDIHRNAYGGPVEPDSPVVQVLSSGAGLGHLLLRRFPGSFATVRVDGDALQGQVFIDFHEAGAPPRTAATLSLAQGRWAATPPSGECRDAADDQDRSRYVGELAADANASPLTVFCWRERGKQATRDDIDLTPDRLDEDGFVDAAPGTERPEVIEVSVSAGAAGTLHVSRARVLPWEQRADEALQQAFERAARLGQSRSVALFIHGFGKSFAASLDQALQLRSVYPQCEPVLYSWPTGAESGFAGLLDSFGASWKVADEGGNALEAALKSFCRAAKNHPAVNAVVVARSLGAEALRCARWALQSDDTRVLKRVLLSAPATALADHDNWVKKLRCPVVVTINRNDNRLKYLRAWTGHRKPLGNHSVDAKDRAGNAIYLDMTDVESVLNNHDYLLRLVNPALTRLNAELLSGGNFNATAVPGLVL